MTAYIAPSLQTLADGPGPLTEADRGKFLLWDGRRVDAAAIELRGGAVVVGGGGTSTLVGATDFIGTPGAGTDGYAIVWDDGAGAFTLGTFEAAGAAAAAVLTHVGAADPHTGYLLASGARAGATGQAQAFTSGIVTGIVRPASDSTIAFRVQNATASVDVITVDTANHALKLQNVSANPWYIYHGIVGDANGYLKIGRSLTAFDFAITESGNTLIGSGKILMLQGSASINAIESGYTLIATNSGEGMTIRGRDFLRLYQSDTLLFQINATGIGFYGVTPVAKPMSGANLTNNVTSGGTDNTISNWTDLTTYATDAAAIRNAIYQLARKLKQINDGLRALGLMT